MKNIYYMIWVDGLIRLKSIPANRTTWKLYGVIFISMAMALNLVVIMAIIQRNIIGFELYNLDLNFIPAGKINSIIKFFILFFAPPLIINFLFIFRNKRYEKLFKKYKSYDGKLCASYMIISYFLPLVLMLDAYLLEKW